MNDQCYMILLPDFNMPHNLLYMFLRKNYKFFFRKRSFSGEPAILHRMSDFL